MFTIILTVVVTLIWVSVPFLIIGFADGFDKERGHIWLQKPYNSIRRYD